MFIGLTKRLAVPLQWKRFIGDPCFVLHTTPNMFFMRSALDNSVMLHRLAIQAGRGDS